MNLDVEVAKLKVLKADHQSQKYRLEDKLLKEFPASIQCQKTEIAALQQDAKSSRGQPTGEGRLLRHDRERDAL